MKKFYFLVSGLLLSMGAMAQVQNGGFETWTTGEADNWSSANELIGLAVPNGGTVTIGGSPTTVAVTEGTTNPLEGSSYANLQSFSLAGLAAFGVPDGVYGANISQAIETTNKYSGVAFAYRADLVGTDAVGVIVTAKKNGATVGQNYRVYNASQATWVRDTIAMSYSATPDTIEIEFGSSFGTLYNIPNTPIPTADGTVMEVDDVQFLAVPVYADAASNVVATDIADNGDGRDLQVTFDAAADESTVSEYRIFVMAENLTLVDWSGAPAGIYETVTPNGSASYTHVHTQTSIYLAPVGGNNVGPALIAENIPMDVYVLSMADGTNAEAAQISVLSNTITLDGYVGLSTETVQNVVVYPNPAQNQVNVIAGFDEGSVVINSITGQEVVNGAILNGGAKLDVSNLKSGIYIYTIRNQEGNVVKTNKLVIQ